MGVGDAEYVHGPLLPRPSVGSRCIARWDAVVAVNVVSTEGRVVSCKGRERGRYTLRPARRSEGISGNEMD